MGIKHLFSLESESHWVKAVKAPFHAAISQGLRTLCVVVVMVVVTWPISWGVTLWLWQSLPLSAGINPEPKYDLSILTSVHFLSTGDY